MRYALRRLGFYLLAAWASLTLNFFLPRLMPGDPATAIFARFQGKIAPETLESMRAAMGLSDAPAIEQYIAYLGHVLRGDMGQSIAYGTDVMTVIGPALLWTMVIALTSLIIAFVLGTLLGIMAAWNRGGKLDTIGPPVLAFFGAFPYFWLAMLLLYLLGFGLDWFPVRHAYSDHLSPELSFTFVADVMAHAVLPVTSIVLATLGGWMLSMRNVMVSVLGDDYIRMARAKGLKPRR
ncbi:MAG: peptide/nickel transport system permease protein, partial [Myxococcota bacterium]